MLDYQLREENFLVIETTAEGVKCGPADPSSLPAFSIEFEDGQVPFKDGVICNWSLLEELWNRCLQHLKIKKSRNHSPVLISLPSLTSRREMETITQMFFEKYNVPGLYLADYSLMSMYGYGQHLTGLAVHISTDFTYVLPIIDAIPQYNCAVKTGVGYVNVANLLEKSLSSDAKFRRYLEASSRSKFLNHLITGVCEVSATALDVDGSGGKSKKEIPVKDFKYEDAELTIGDARLMAFELLFSPKSFGSNCISIQEAITMSIAKCDFEKRVPLSSHLIVLGRASSCKGLKERIISESKKLSAQSDIVSDLQATDFRTPAMPSYLDEYKSKPEHISYVGGILAAKHIFPDLKNYCSKLDYNELGPTVINIKGY